MLIISQTILKPKAKNKTFRKKDKGQQNLKAEIWITQIKKKEMKMINNK